jgi:Ca2+-binding EF-hand superfamily protein
VLQVHPSPSSALVYNVKLMFEEFGEVPGADVDFEDKFDTMTEREKDAIITNRKFFGAEEDEEEMDAADDGEEGEDTDEVDFEDDFGDYDAEVKEVYEELLANSADGTAQAKKELLVQDLYDWEAVQDMIASGSVSKRDVDEAVRSAGAKLGGALSLEQFDAVVSFLQDRIEGNMQGSSDGEGATRLSAAGAAETLESRSASNNRRDADPEEETEAEDELDDADFEAAQEAFDSLKGADGRVTVANFKAWEDVQAIIEVGAISEKTLDIIINEVVPAASADGAKGKKGKAASMDFEQFSELLMHLDEAAGMHADAGDGEDGDRDGSSSDDEDASEDEAEREALRKEIFEEMANAKGKVPVKDFLAWDEITELVDDGDLDATALRAMVKEVGSSASGALDYDQFCDMLSMIEEATADLDAPDEEGEEPGQVGQRRSDESMTTPANSAARVARSVDEREAERDTAEDAEGDDEPTDEELDEMARLVFAELLPAGKTLLPVKSLLAWDGIKDEIAAGALTKADVARVIKEVDVKSSGLLDFDQFLEVMDAVEEILEASMEDEEEEDGGDDSAPSPVKNSPGKQAPALKQPPALPKSSSEGPKGFGKNPVSASKTSTKNKAGGAESEIEQLTADLYKELKGKVISLILV